MDVKRREGKCISFYNSNYIESPYGKETSQLRTNYRVHFIKLGTEGFSIFLGTGEKVHVRNKIFMCFEQKPQPTLSDTVYVHLTKIVYLKRTLSK